MPRIIKISQAGYSAVYNMEVRKYHNFSIEGGIIVHNCDALRYWCSRRQLLPEANAPTAREGFKACSKNSRGELAEEYLIGGYGAE